MKFIVGLRVWVNGAMGKTPQVFPRIRGSANRRVDLHLPLIASIPGRRGWDIEGLAMPKGITGKSPAPRGIERLNMPRNGTGRRGNWARTNPKCECNSLSAIA